MKNKIYATNGKKGEEERTAKLRVQHWAPGKKFVNGCPIPTFLVNEAKRMKSKRLIYVELTIPPDNTESDALGEYVTQAGIPKPLPESGHGTIRRDTPIIAAWLFCRKKDTVDIDNGIALTISRLAIELHIARLGWHLSL